MGETYNGWANYETWNFNLWEGDYLNEITQELQDDTGEKLDYGQVYAIVNGHLDTIIESKTDENYSDKHVFTPNGFLGDLLDGALSSIDIHEVAQSVYDNLEFEGEEEEEEEEEEE